MQYFEADQNEVNNYLYWFLAGSQYSLMNFRTVFLFRRLFEMGNLPEDRIGISGIAAAGEYVRVSTYTRGSSTVSVLATIGNTDC
jgi:hypothetical protein